MNEMEENMTAYVRYSCFYSASAYLLYKHISAKTHSGVIGQFSEMWFVWVSFLFPTLGFYAKLLNWRSKGDYSDLFDFNQEDVDSMMVSTRVFIDKVAELIDLS